jgi:hypothetical protein
MSQCAGDTDPPSDRAEKLIRRAATRKHMEYNAITWPRMSSAACFCNKLITATLNKPALTP